MTCHFSMKNCKLINNGGDEIEICSEEENSGKIKLLCYLLNKTRLKMSYQ